MKKFLLLLLLLSSTSFASSKSNGQIKFEGEDFFGITDAFTEELASDFTERILTLQGNKLYIYFDSPGGSVFSMARMVETMKSNSNIKYICVARMAASAAFITFENCDERYILPDGVIMSHNARGTFSDEFPRVRTMLDTIEGVFIPIEKAVAKRMKISYRKYKELINNNLWLNSTTAPKNNAVEDVIEGVSCSKELVEKRIIKNQSVDTLFGPVAKQVIVSACPLITNPKQAESSPK